MHALRPYKVEAKLQFGVPLLLVLVRRAESNCAHESPAIARVRGTFRQQRQFPHQRPPIAADSAASSQEVHQMTVQPSNHIPDL